MMAVEEQQDSEVNTDPSSRPVSFVEIVCGSSGRRRRFAAGTNAGFAVALINRKLNNEPRVWHIEAVKEGEEPISFGPTSVLVNYGDDWHLQTVDEPEGLLAEKLRPPPGISVQAPRSMKPEALQPSISFSYIGKIILAFVFIFILGAALTLALENLPRLILYMNSSM